MVVAICIRGGGSGRDSKVTGLTSTLCNHFVSSILNRGEVFVSDLSQVFGYSNTPVPLPPIELTRYGMTEILLKVALKSIKIKLDSIISKKCTKYNYNFPSVTLKACVVITKI